LATKLGRKKQFGRSLHRYEDTVAMYLKVCGVAWIGFLCLGIGTAGQLLMNVVLNLLVS
jgi:hypothetical protein